MKDPSLSGAKVSDKILPGFLIVGAAKSGTTTLYQILRNHPEIFMPEIKEPCFFSSYNLPENILKRNIYPYNPNKIVKDISEYKRLFSDINLDGVKLMGEASTHYLFQHNETILNIKKFYNNPDDIKIIIVLRNPVEAAFSNYTMWAMQGNEVPQFEYAIKEEKQRIKEKKYNIAYINKFNYYRQINNYMDNFNKVHIILFEDLKFDLKNTLAKLYNFLGISNNQYKNELGLKFNISGKIKFNFLHEFLINPNNRIKSIFRPIIRVFFKAQTSAVIMNKLIGWNLQKQVISLEIEDKLKTIFKPDILKTQSLINRDLSAWL